MFVRRIPMSEVPESEEESAKFLHNLYKEKDDIYDVYDKTGSFKSLGLKAVDLPYNYYDLYICIVWVVLLSIPIFYGLFLFLKSATLLMNIALFGFLFLCELIDFIWKQFK